MHARILLPPNVWLAVTMLALGAFMVPRAHAADLEQLAKRVQILEDREEIRAVILAYGQAHDHRDYKMFASLFATNGSGVWARPRDRTRYSR
jgi:SnoaL-like domain